MVVRASALAWLEEWSRYDLHRRWEPLRTVLIIAALIIVLPILVGCIGCCVNERGRSKMKKASASSTQLETLRTAKDAAARRRERVSGTLLSLGWFLVVFAWTTPIGIMGTGANKTYEPLIGSFPFYVTAFGPGGAVMLLAVQPTDTGLIRTACAFMFGLTSFLTLLFAFSVITSVMDSDEVSTSEILYSIVSVVMLCVSIFLSPVLLCECCPCCAPRAMQPRVALLRLWASVRVFLFALALVLFNFVLVPLVGGTLDLSRNETPTGCILILIVWVGVAAFATPRNRGRLHRFLFQLGSTSGQGSAEEESAIIASLIGGVSAESALTLGESRFRALPLSDLSAEDLKTNSDTGLFKKTRTIKLGEASAFISHSWSDEGAVKYARLQDWSAGKSDVLVWLDKVTLALEAPSLSCCPLSSVSERLTHRYLSACHLLGMHRPGGHCGESAGVARLLGRLPGASCASWGELRNQVVVPDGALLLPSHGRQADACLRAR